MRSELRRTISSKRLRNGLNVASNLNTYQELYADSAPTVDSGTTGFAAYWNIARRKKLLLISLGLVGLLTGYAIAKTSARVYQARIILEVLNLNDNFLNMRDTSPTATVGGGNDYDVHTQTMLLQTPSLLQRTAQKMAATGRPSSPGLTASEISRRIRDLRVHDSERTRILEVTCDSSDPQLAADFLNALAGEFIDQRLETRWNSTSHTAAWLTGELNSLKSKLEQSEARLQSYASASGLMFAGKDNVDEEKLRLMQEQLAAAQAELAVKRSRYEMAASSSPDSLPEVRDDATIRDYQTSLAQLRRQFAELNSSYTPAHYKVRRVQAEIAAVESALENERVKTVRRIENEYHGAVRREALLSQAYRTQAALVLYLSGKAIHYDVLKREVDTERRLYEDMLAKVKEAGISSALRASNLRVADAAQTPSAPYKPRVAETSAIGMLAGVFAGWLFVFIRHRSDPKIYEPGEAAGYLRVPELGVVMSARMDNALAGEIDQGGPLAQLTAGFVRGGDRSSAVELACLHHKDSLLAESFRMILTSILSLGQEHRVLVFASASPRDGKTMIVSNLGVMLAAMKKRVLIVDADVRKPGLNHIFQSDSARGLTDLLLDPAPLDELNENSLELRTDVPGLYLLPAGSGPVDLDLMYSPRLLHLLQKFRQEFDMVLIDTPAVMHIPDARVLGSIADGVILVCRASHTSREAAFVVRQRFAQDGIPVLGTVLNDWNPRTTAYGHYRPKGFYEHYQRVNKS